MSNTKTLKKGNIFSAFLKEVRNEIRQVTWPTREEAIRLTTLVVIISLAVGLYLGGLDYLFTLLMGYLI